MSIIAPLAVDQATPEAQETLAAIQSLLGVTPNLYRVAANAPAALSGLAQMSGALAKGRLRAKVPESIALTVAQENACDYCLSAHSLLGGAAGLTAADIAKARAASGSFA